MFAAGISKATTSHFFGEKEGCVKSIRIILCVLSLLAITTALTFYFKNLNEWKFVAMGAAGCEGSALIAAYFAPKNVVFPFTTEEIEALSDMGNLEDKDLAFEIPEFTQLLENQALAPLIEAYKQTNYPDFLLALHVFLGLKPALALEYCTPKMRQLIEDVVQAMGNKKIHFYAVGEYHYLVHEGELEKVQRFLHPSYHNTSLPTIFEKRSEVLPSQILSYYLGYGPTWEVFNGGYSKPYLIFSDEHYRQIGDVLLASKPECDLDAITLGKMYLSLRKKEHDSKHCRLQEFQKLGIFHAVDGITARTEYFRRLYTLKKQVADFLN